MSSCNEIIICKEKCCPDIPITKKNTDTINLITFPTRAVDNISFYEVTSFVWIPNLYQNTNKQLIYSSKIFNNPIEFQMVNLDTNTILLNFFITLTETKIININLPLVKSKIVFRIRALNSSLPFGVLESLQLYFSSLL